MLEQNTEELRIETENLTTSINNEGVEAELPKLKTLDVHTPSLDIEVEENRVMVTPRMETDYIIAFKNFENLKKAAQEIVDFDVSSMDFSLENVKLMKKKLEEFGEIYRSVSFTISAISLVIKHRHLDSFQEEIARKDLRWVKMLYFIFGFVSGISFLTLIILINNYLFISNRRIDWKNLIIAIVVLIVVIYLIYNFIGIAIGPTVTNKNGNTCKGYKYGLKICSGDINAE